MKRKLTLSLVVVISVASIIGVGLHVIAQSTPPCLPSYVPKLQAGIGAQAPCPSSISNIGSAISNASLFMDYRCDLHLSDTMQQRLAQLEQATWPGQSNGEARLTRTQM